MKFRPFLLELPKFHSIQKESQSLVNICPFRNAEGALNQTKIEDKDDNSKDPKVREKSEIKFN